jgi:hypothetical protein
MKDEAYDALAALNRGFGMMLESLKILHEEGVVTQEYVQRKREIAEELRADINALLLNKLEAREIEDREHFGKMRANNAKRLKAMNGHANSSRTHARTTKQASEGKANYLNIKD